MYSFVAGRAIRVMTILLLVAAMSCKSEKQQAVHHQEDDQVELGDDFWEFYERFHKDGQYQLDHIIFPLEGEKPASDSLMSSEVMGVFWQKNDWILHRPIDDHDGHYRRQFKEFSGIVVESIGHTEAPYAMERRFSIIGDEWQLIYYASMRLME